MTQPGATDITNPREPGSPFWWLSRLAQKLLDRQEMYDFREDMYVGNHPLPNGDRRFVKALRQIQDKAKTNYIQLVTNAVTQKLRLKGFQFGEEFADEEAQRIWQHNDMDFQSPVIINDAAVFGFAYAKVEDADEEEPLIVIKDPRKCEIERDPNRPTKTLAGLEFWVDPIEGVMAILYLPDVTYYLNAAPVNGDTDSLVSAVSNGISSALSRFQIVRTEVNELGEVPLERLDWIPSAGEAGCSEGQPVFDIQDRINKTVLDRMVISNAQAYRQRWMTGGPKKDKNGKSPFDPGADMVWASANADTKFGDFDQADITQILESIRDDVGDMSAISQTPATFLTNRMVNVSGDTLVQTNAGYHAKCHLRADSVGWFFERLVKKAFRYKGNLEKAKDVTAHAVWHPIEVRSIAEVADAYQKFLAGNVPMELAMKKTGLFTDEEIKWAKEEAERLKQEEMARQDEVMDKTAQVQEKQLKMKSSQQPTAKPKSKSSSK